MRFSLKHITFVFALSPFFQGVTAQNVSPLPVLPDNKVMMYNLNYEGEELPTSTLREVPVTARRVFKTEEERLAYYKLRRDVKRAYPYAVLASVKLKEYDAAMDQLPERKRKVYLRKTEKELKEQFERDLKKLTINQGRILIRLINRETGLTTYKVIREYRGSVSAFLWQSFGLLFGNNLKWKYDPTQGEDMMIEEIIREIQDGEV